MEIAHNAPFHIYWVRVCFWQDEILDNFKILLVQNKSKNADFRILKGLWGSGKQFCTTPLGTWLPRQRAAAGLRRRAS